MKTRHVSFATVLFGVALALTPGVAMSEGVGSAAAVKPASTGTPPGSASRTLQIGTEIQARERIQTTQSGSLQVMFLDKTTLTIGPNSDLVVDDFVFKKGATTGRFAARLTKGALRFVGGQISHTAGATITTPAATIGIRGGAALITHDSVCQANLNKSGQHVGSCTKVVCMIGTCQVKSLTGGQNLQLKISQAVEISALAASSFDVKSVTLNDVSKGGDGNIIPGDGDPSGQAKFSGQNTLDETIAQQQPEPVALTPPTP
ncbi:MAG: FecR domain-containing protein [Bauldia sp.]